MRDHSAAVVALAAFLMAGHASAQEPDWYEMTAKRQADGVRSMEADIVYMVGELRIFPARAGLLYDAHLRYDALRFEPSREWSVHDGVGHLRVHFEGRDEGAEWEDLKDLDDGDFGFLSLGLSPDVETALTVAVGAARSRLDLGGIPLTHLEYKTGASETDLAFDVPNPVNMQSMELAAGAADFEATGLGNARFDKLVFQGAIGHVTLDFTGEWDGDGDGEASAKISMGLGGLTLRFPRDLGVRVDKSGILVSFESEGFEKTDGGYRTPNWESASHRLDIDVKAVLGDVDVEFVR